MNDFYYVRRIRHFIITFNLYNRNDNCGTKQECNYQKIEETVLLFFLPIIKFQIQIFYDKSPFD